MRKGGATTSGYSKSQRFACTLKQRPLPTAAIKACSEGTRKPRYRKNAAKRIRYPQPTRKVTAPSPANASFAKTSSLCLSVSKSSLTVTATAGADSACASSLSPQSTTWNSKCYDGYARGLIEAGRFDLKEEAVALAHVVAECRRLLALRAKKRQVTFEQ